MRRGLVIPAALTVLMVVAAVGVVLMKKGEERPSEVTVTMADAGPVENGLDVRAGGVRVGSVKTMKLVDEKARLTLQVDPSVLPLHKNASVTVRPANLLGEVYLDLHAGSDSSPFTDSTEIPASRAKLAVTVQDLLDTFNAPTAAALADVVTTGGQGFQGNGESVAAALAELSSSMTATEKLGSILSRQNDQLADLVASTDPVVAAIATKDGRTLDSLLESTTEALNAIRVQQEALKETIAQLPATLASAHRTLAQLQGVADETTPLLQDIRPLTGDLSKVVEELDQFNQTAGPALTSLEPVLDEANALLDQAAPAVAQLRGTGPHLARAAHSLGPINEELLEKNLGGVMAFVRKWAMSTNGYDGLSHYFRGVVYVTPETLASLLKSFLPTQVDLPKSVEDATKGLKGGLGVGDLGAATGELSGQVGGLTKGLTSQKSSDPAPDALGLTSKQEESMVGQLFGGGN